jgi:hypothetical protein
MRLRAATRSHCPTRMAQQQRHRLPTHWRMLKRWWMATRMRWRTWTVTTSRQHLMRMVQVT